MCSFETWDAYSPVLFQDEIPCGEPYYTNTACVQAVYSDFNIQPVPPTEPEHPFVSDACDWGGDLVSNVILSGARPLLTTNFGSIDELEGGAMLSDDFVSLMREVSEESGVSAMNAVLYNFVTSVTKETVVGHRDDAYMSFNSEEQILKIHQEHALYDGAPLGVILIHEARHAYGFRHTACRNPYQAGYCDDGLNGSFGFELSVWYLFAQQEQVIGYEDYIVRFVKNKMQEIHVFQDELGFLLPEWDAISDIEELKN